MTDPVWLPPLTVEAARQALCQACRHAGLDDRGAELIRLGSNAVFRMSGEVVARVARTGSHRFRLGVDVARWLESEGFPAVRALPVDQPVVVDGRAVTFWTSVSDHDEYATVAEVAEVIRRLHQLRQPASLATPTLDPFVGGERRIASAVAVSEDDRRFLSDRLARLRRAYHDAVFELPAGVIHGDASIGNVVHDRSGKPVLIDLDGFAVGPREWDLVLTALYYARFGWHTDEEYADFVGVYGYDVRRSHAYELLCDLRELLMVAWLSQKAGDDEQAAREVAARVESMRTGGSRRNWSAY